jgi:hypothetical protein
LTVRVTLNGQKWSKRFETVQTQKVPNGERLARWMPETLAASRQRHNLKIKCKIITHNEENHLMRGKNPDLGRNDIKIVVNYYVYTIF